MELNLQKKSVYFIDPVGSFTSNNCIFDVSLNLLYSLRFFFVCVYLLFIFSFLGAKFDPIGLH